jgi:hypothetical protein
LKSLPSFCLSLFAAAVSGGKYVRRLRNLRLYAASPEMVQYHRQHRIGATVVERRGRREYRPEAGWQQYVERTGAVTVQSRAKRQNYNSIEDRVGSIREYSPEAGWRQFVERTGAVAVESTAQRQQGGSSL